MANLNYHKFLRFCNKQIDENPFLVKAILIHIVLIILLYILSFVSSLKFEKTQASLSAQVSNMPKKFEIIQATSISSSELNKQMSAYESHKQELKQAREDIKQAKLQALRKHQQQLKEKAEVERKAKQQAEERACEERLAKARAEAEAAARKQIEQNEAQSAISSYITAYQDRVGANWIKDSCRGIYDLPRAIIRDGKFIKLTGTSGNYRCDQSLIDAIKNTTPPVITNDVAKKTIQIENISFIFKQS